MEDTHDTTGINAKEYNQSRHTFQPTVGPTQPVLWIPETLDTDVKQSEPIADRSRVSNAVVTQRVIFHPFILIHDVVMRFN
jgi:hypothetical protein